jgi:large subunit ribosomal protein L22
MRTAKAQLKHAHMSPQKVRRVADVVRGASVSAARIQLGVLPQRPAPVLQKLLASAVANAKQNGLNEEQLVIHELKADEGPTLKRFMPRAHGRATTIRKRTSHITLVVREKEL